MSDCRSFGSNYHPSSQSRKISVGIMIDSKKRAAAMQEGENAEKETFVEGENKGKGFLSVNKRKQIEVQEQPVSPWITTRSFHPKNPISESVNDLPATSGRGNKPSRGKDVPIIQSVHLFSNKTLKLPPADGKQKRDVLTYTRKGRKDGNLQNAEDFTFNTAHEVLLSDKVVPEDKTEDGRTETLRMKLWKILGTVSSPKSQTSNSQAREMGANNLKPDQIPYPKGNAVVKPIQSSDTIETDSESSEHAMKRPVTRSLARKRASAKAQPDKRKAGSSYSHRPTLQEKNIFCFKAGSLRKDDGAENGGTSIPTRKKFHRKTFTLEPRKICFTEIDNAVEMEGVSHKREKSLPAEKTHSLDNRMELSDPPNKRDCPEQNIGNQERDSHQSLGTQRIDKLDDFQSPAIGENADQGEEICNPMVKNVMDHLDDFQSPTFKINTPVLSSSPSSTPKTDRIKHVVSSTEAAERISMVGNVRSFGMLQASKADCYHSDPQTESSDESQEPTDFPSSKPSPLKAKEDAEDGISDSSSEDGDSESSDDGLPITKGHRKSNTFPPESTTSERSTFMLHPSKKFCNCEHRGASKSSPTSPSPRGFDESDWISEPYKENKMDDLERVAMLFASALENLKNKLNSATRKKTSEILMLVYEAIQLQLQNVESQIQTDLMKLTSVSKLKRKRVETRFQEQQEQLKLIHDKFKQDIHQNLQDCKSTLEGLEVDQIELKGSLKKQKALHRKLLVQVEETVEAQLSDAQRRIATVHKLARKKMLQLKQIMAEFLNEGFLS